MSIRKTFGWIPDIPDFRDWTYTLEDVQIVPTVDLRQRCSPVENQFSLNSCTANSVVGALEILENIKSLPALDLSRLFVYYNARDFAGSTGSDNGVSIRNAIKSLVSFGVCAENLWPYSIIDVNKKPSAPAYTDAIKHRAGAYYRLSTLADMKNCLAAGYPFVFGFMLYESFYTYNSVVSQTGEGSMPLPGDIPVSAHAVTAVGYDNTTQRFLLRNSWGTAWGNGGYFTLPFAYVEDPALASDFWTIRTFYEEPVLEVVLSGVLPLDISIAPSAAYFTDSITVHLIPNKSADIQYSIDGGAQIDYTGPFIVGSTCTISYQGVDETAVPCVTKTQDYEIDTNPLTIVPKFGSGVYKGVLFELVTNKPCYITYTVNGGILQEYTNPIDITATSVIQYTGMVDNTTYPTKTLNYTISDSAGLVCINPLPYAAYSVETFLVTLGITPEVICDILYSVNNGNWLTYSLPFWCKHFDVLRVKALYHDSSESDVQVLNYTIVDKQDEWINLG